MDNDFATGYALGADSGNNNSCNSNGMWGDGWWAIIIFAMIFGWGNGGWGGFGNGGGNGALTRSDLCSEFSFNDLQGAVRGVQSGICDSTYALNNSIMSGFHGVDNAICSSTNAINSGITQLGYQMQDCCCNVRSDIKDLSYQNAKNTCDIIQASHNDTDRIINFLTQEKLDSLRDQLQTANFQLSQQAQSNNIINALRPTPQPAYITCSPYESALMYAGYGRTGCGCNSGCGC